jgi:hypothetical protein
MATVFESRNLTDREREGVGLSDSQLVRKTYEMITLVKDDDLTDDLYFLVAEIVERWAPEVELAERIHNVRRDELSDPAGEIEASLERIVGRFAARVQRHAGRLANDRSVNIAAARKATERALAILEGP